MNIQERAEYALVLSQAKKRFGSPCPHKQVKRGFCTTCLRKVVTPSRRRR